MPEKDGSSANIVIVGDFRKEEDRRTAIRYTLTPVRILLDTRKIAPPRPFVNPHLLLDAIVHCQTDLRQFCGPDAFKIGGRLGFWISRLKPFRALDQNTLFTNEMLGLVIGLSVVWESMGHKRIPHKVHANLLYDLRYGTVTASVFSNQLQLLYCEEICGADIQV